MPKLLEMMKKTILFINLLGAPMLAMAEQPQFVIGVKGGYQWVLDDNYNHSNPEDAIWGLYSGLQLTPSWRWDIGYQYHNELEADAYLQTSSINVKTWLLESAFRYDWYLQDNLSLYGRVGAAYWNMESTYTNKHDTNGFSPLGELGVSYQFTPNSQISTGYQYIDSIGKLDADKYHSHGFLISLAYTFGSTSQSTSIETTPAIEIEKEVVTISPPSPNANLFAKNGKWII